MKIFLILVLSTQIFSYTYNILVVNDLRIWTREITEIAFNNDSLHIKSWECDTVFSVSDVDTVYFDSTGYISRYIPGQVYLMGTRASFPSTRIHTVRVYDFYADVGLVSQSEYKRLMGQEPWLRYEGPCENVGDSLPANTITWADACMYCNARSIDEGLEPVYDFNIIGTLGDSCVVDTGGIDTAANGWRLATEAEFEYLQRSGNFNTHLQDTSETRFWGKDWFPEGDTLAWFPTIETQEMHEVCSKKPSPYGMYDIEGHMYEWCWDVYSQDWYTAYPQDYVYEGWMLWGPGGARSGPNPIRDNKKRVIRGSVMWGRMSKPDTLTAYYMGFRCVRFASQDK